MSGNPEILQTISSLREQADAMAGQAPETITAFDWAKTLGMVHRLLDTAERIENKTMFPPRMPWSDSGFETPAVIARQAAEYIASLNAGRDPLAGKFAEPGGTVIDHALIEKDGLHHLFYIRGRACTHWPEWPTRNFGHAVSKDLVHWEVRNPVLQSPDYGWDEFQVWAPHVIEHAGEYWMFYTGVNEFCCQAVGLARSKDLFHWKRHGEGPIITPGEWGLWGARQGSDCRDPMVLKDGDTFYCYYTAIQKTGKVPESCVGISSSKDLLNWKDEGFIRLEHSHKTPPESPFVVKRDGRFYLFYTSYDHGTVYAVSDHPVTGWTELPVEQMVLEAKISASEIYETGGEWYMSVITHDPNHIHMFAVRHLIWGEDGSLRAESL